MIKRNWTTRLCGYLANGERPIVDNIIFSLGWIYKNAPRHIGFILNSPGNYFQIFLPPGYSHFVLSFCFCLSFCYNFIFSGHIVFGRGRHCHLKEWKDSCWTSFRYIFFCYVNLLVSIFHLLMSFICMEKIVVFKRRGYIQWRFWEKNC